MVISKTPLRISFAGGGTDLPSFYKKTGHGAVLSTCIDSYIYVSIKEHSPLFDEKIRLNYSETELVNDVSQIKNSIIRECLKFLEIDDRLYISTIADAPAMSGLGSSSAFCVGLLNALYKYKKVPISPGRLAEEAAYIEINVLKRPIGKQDHYAAAFGGLNYFVFHSDDTTTVKPLNINEHRINSLSDGMISFWTKETRLSESVLTEQNNNSGKNKDLLMAMRQQAAELMDFLYNGDFSVEKFGKIIHDGWEMKRKLASKISNATIDKYYEMAIKHGAYGGKISGAGGGGFLNIFAAIPNQKIITDALQAAGLVPFKFNFETRGTAVMKFD